MPHIDPDVRIPTEPQQPAGAYDNPAAALYALLATPGARDNRRTAALVDEHESNWHDCRGNKSSPTAKKIRKWRDALEARGVDVELKLDGDGWSARVFVDPRTPQGAEVARAMASDDSDRHLATSTPAIQAGAGPDSLPSAS